MGPGEVTVQQLYCAPLPQRGGVAVGGIGDSVEGGGPTTTGVSSELSTGVSSELTTGVSSELVTGLAANKNVMFSNHMYV